MPAMNSKWEATWRRTEPRATTDANRKMSALGQKQTSRFALSMSAYDEQDISARVVFRCVSLHANLHIKAKRGTTREYVMN